MPWYALYTKPRWEKKVASQLEKQEFTIYCPVMKVQRQWSDRKKTVIEPVFRGYIFIHCITEKLWESLATNGVVNVVRYLGKPAIIRDEEIDTIKKFLDEFENIEVQNIALEPASRVRIRSGVMMNYEGIIVEVYGNRAVVKIDSLGLQLSAQFDRGNLERI